MIPPTNKGIIELTTSSSNPLKNELVLVVRWSTKDYTDTDHHSAIFYIKENQWEEILKRKLIGKQVEFDLLDEENKLIKITFLPIPYTEKEAEELVFKTWEKFSSFRYNEPQIDKFNEWWDSIKKTK